MEKRKLTVEVLEEDLALWKEAAHQRRLTLSAWVRVVLNANAKMKIGKAE